MTSSKTASKLSVPTTVILDFYDSYTRNLLVLFRQLASIHEASWDTDGWEDRVVVINVDSVSWLEFTQEVIPNVSCIILGPGPGSPHQTSDFSWTNRLIQEFGGEIPILGVCLGHQGLASAFGGKVVKAPSPRHGQVTKVEHSSHLLFGGIPSPFDAVQFNSLEVSEDSIPESLEVTAWAATPCGHKSVMGLRHRSQPLWGVQFHPESISSTYGAHLLSNFLQMAISHLASRPRSFDQALPIPRHIISLSTSYRRGRPNLIPDVPSVPSTFLPSKYRWEQRSFELGSGGGRTPQEVFEGFVKGSSPLGEIWLDSARATSEPQFSHVLVPQLTWSYSRATNSFAVATSPHISPNIVNIKAPQTFISVLAKTQGVLKRATNVMDSSLPSVPVGFVGSLSYEMNKVTLPQHEPPAEPECRTDSEFAFVSTALSYSHEMGTWRATALVRLPSSASSPATDQEEYAVGSTFGIDDSAYKSWSAVVQTYFASPRTFVETETPRLGLSLHTKLVPDLSHSAYIDAIERARTLIRAGESYELCLTNRFRTSLPEEVATSPYQLYLSLRAHNPARYSAFVHLPLSALSILSSSPERFIRIDKHGQAEMQPIKGTVRRSEDPVEDQRRKAALEANEKERAENLMIVDLSRNDLLGFCEVDSVQVPKLIQAETVQTVHQLVTSITGTLSSALSPFEAVGRAFPPGSMTGAPKVRSVKLLEELEGNRPRGIYSGALGYVAVDGATDFAVVIRTLIIEKNSESTFLCSPFEFACVTELTLGAGGAITHLSEAESEWEEVLVKKDAVVSQL
ncbi:ADC synthase [Meredithblackwellia eburnea MCA 4105]